jgi:hypothetical protein
MFEIKIDVKLANNRDVIGQAARETAKIIRERSRQDIAGALNRPGRFVKGLTTRVRSISKGYAIQVFQWPSYAKVWEYGGTSVGKPLLWLPAMGNRLKRRNYLGKLIRPPGKNVLMSTGAGVAVRGIFGTGPKREVKFIGVRSVTHRKRFHLREIALDEASKFATRMRQFVRPV